LDRDRDFFLDRDGERFLDFDRERVFDRLSSALLPSALSVLPLSPFLLSSTVESLLAL
jgi:hypothetical protein